MALDSLNQYGNAFQIKVIANLLKQTNKVGDNNEFIAQIFDILTPDFFESDANQWIISKIIDYYKKYLKPPTIDYFKAEFVSVDEITREAIKENLKEAYKYIQNGVDLDYIKDEFLEFCQNQNMKQAILESVDLLKAKDYHAIKHLVDEALKFGNSKRDLGHVYEDMIEDRIVKTPRTKVTPTEWAIINEIMDGGAGAGDLIILIGAAGSGKCVGPNTKIDIKYEEIGIEIDGKIEWYKPWQKVKFEGEEKYAYEVLVIWENDWKNNTDKIKNDIRKFLHD